MSVPSAPFHARLIFVCLTLETWLHVLIRDLAHAPLYTGPAVPMLRSVAPFLCFPNLCIWHYKGKVIPSAVKARRVWTQIAIQRQGRLAPDGGCIVRWTGIYKVAKEITQAGANVYRISIYRESICVLAEGRWLFRFTAGVQVTKTGSRTAITHYHDAKSHGKRVLPLSQNGSHSRTRAEPLPDCGFPMLLHRPIIKAQLLPTVNVSL